MIPGWAPQTWCREGGDLFADVMGDGAELAMGLESDVAERGRRDPSPDVAEGGGMRQVGGMVTWRRLIQIGKRGRRGGRRAGKRDKLALHQAPR